MTTLLSIDPGVKTVAWALFRKGYLVDVQLSRAKSLEEQIGGLQLPEAVAKVVIEVPQVYASSPRAEDLIRLAMVAGACLKEAGRYGHEIEALLVKPHAWKGTVPKDIHNKRVLKRLDRQERSLVEDVNPKSLRHNAIDAVGIGLWALGRNQ